MTFSHSYLLCADLSNPTLTTMSVLVLVQKSTPVGRCLLASCKSKGSLMTRRSFSPMAWYNKQLKRAPLVTKSITSGSESTSAAKYTQSNYFLSLQFCLVVGMSLLRWWLAMTVLTLLGLGGRGYLERSS